MTTSDLRTHDEDTADLSNRGGSSLAAENEVSGCDWRRRTRKPMRSRSLVDEQASAGESASTS
jgi:hypothetical protein